MAKFNFRLQNYLSLKEKLEEQRKLEYGMALAALENERRAEAAIIAEKADKINEFSEMARKKIEPDKFALYNIYIEILKKRLIEQKKRVAQAEAFAEKKRLILVEAMKEKKALQRLREKDYEEYATEEKRLEQRVVDETVSYKYANVTQSARTIDEEA